MFRMLKIKRVIYTVMGMFGVLAFSRPALALQFFNDSKFTGKLELGTVSPDIVSLRIIKAILQLLGIIVVALVIYGGIRWMLARGNEEEVTKAKEILKAALIGLVVILASYSIADYVFSWLCSATTGIVCN